MTNTLPGPVHALILLFVWTVLAARWTLLRFTTYDVRLTHALTFACVALTLKDPTVASVLTPELGATLVRTLVHVLILLSIAALVGVYNSWDSTEPRWKQPALYAAAAGIGSFLLVLSAPARAAGTTVESAGGWQAIAYFALYAGFNVYGLGRVTIDYLRSWRNLRTWRGRSTVTCVIVFFVSMLVESLQMLAAAILTNLDRGHAFVAAKANSNGWLFAVMMLVAVAMSAVPFLTAGSRDAIRDRILVHRLWKDLARAEPDLVFGTVRDRRSLSANQLMIRVASEAYDVAQRLNQYSELITADQVPPHELRGLSTYDRAVLLQAMQLQNAIERRRSGAEAVAETRRPPSVHDDAEAALTAMTAVARHWTRARRLRRTLTAGETYTPVA